MPQYKTDIFRIRMNVSHAAAKSMFIIDTNKDTFYHEYVGAAI